MRIALPLAAALALCAGAWAQPGDPLKSPACGAALAHLQYARSAGAPAREVEGLRGAASAACLGSAAVPARPSRVVRAPVVVPPPQIEVPQRAAPLPEPVLPPPPVALERAPAPALCDVNGCWTSGAPHLRHVPPNLAGPGGLCIAQGGAIVCP